MAVPSTSTRCIDSFGNSLVAATRSRVTLLNPGGQFLLDRFTDLGDRKPVEDFTQEPLDQHPLGNRSRDATADQVEEGLRVHRPAGRPGTAPEDGDDEDLDNRLLRSIRR